MARQTERQGGRTRDKDEENERRERRRRRQRQRRETRYGDVRRRIESLDRRDVRTRRERGPGRENPLLQAQRRGALGEPTPRDILNRRETKFLEQKIGFRDEIRRGEMTPFESRVEAASRAFLGTPEGFDIEKRGDRRIATINEKGRNQLGKRLASRAQFQLESETGVDVKKGRDFEIVETSQGPKVRVTDRGKKRIIREKVRGELDGGQRLVDDIVVDDRKAVGKLDFVFGERRNPVIPASVPTERKKAVRRGATGATTVTTGTLTGFKQPKSLDKFGISLEAGDGKTTEKQKDGVGETSTATDIETARNTGAFGEEVEQTRFLPRIKRQDIDRSRGKVTRRNRNQRTDLNEAVSETLFGVTTGATKFAFDVSETTSDALVGSVIPALQATNDTVEAVESKAEEYNRRLDEEVSPVARPAISKDQRDQALRGERTIVDRGEKATDKIFSGKAPSERGLDAILFSGGKVIQFAGEDIRDFIQDKGQDAIQAVPYTEKVPDFPSIKVPGTNFKTKEQGLGEIGLNVVSSVPSFGANLIGGGAQAPVAVKGLDADAETAGTLAGTSTRASVNFGEYFAKRPGEALFLVGTAKLRTGRGRVPRKKPTKVSTKSRFAEAGKTAAEKFGGTTKTEAPGTSLYRGLVFEKGILKRKGSRPVIGRLEGKTRVGTPKTELDALTPFEPINPTETRIFKQNLRRQLGKEKFERTIGAKEKIDVLGRETFFSKKKSQLGRAKAKTRTLRESLEQSPRIPDEAVPGIIRVLKENDAEVFGSIAQATQLRRTRRPKDLDIAVKQPKKVKSELQRVVEEAGGGEGKVFDVKPKSQVQEGFFGFGRRTQGRVKTQEGVKVQKLGEQLQRKTGGSLFLRGKERLGPEHPGRFKDPYDASVIAEQLISERKSGVSRFRPLKRYRTKKAEEGLESFREATFETARTSKTIEEIARGKDLIGVERTQARGTRIGRAVREALGDETAQLDIGRTTKEIFPETKTGETSSSVETVVESRIRRGVEKAGKETSSTVRSGEAPSGTPSGVSSFSRDIENAVSSVVRSSEPESVDVSSFEVSEFEDSEPVSDYEVYETGELGLSGVESVSETSSSRQGPGGFGLELPLEPDSRSEVGDESRLSFYSFPDISRVSQTPTSTSSIVEFSTSEFGESGFDESTLTGRDTPSDFSSTSITDESTSPIDYDIPEETIIPPYTPPNTPEDTTPPPRRDREDPVDTYEEPEEIEEIEDWDKEWVNPVVKPSDILSGEFGGEFLEAVEGEDTSGLGELQEFEKKLRRKL